jgi:hypothetical protein
MYTWRETVNWFNLAQDRVQRWTLVITVMTFRVSYEAENFLHICSVVGPKEGLCFMEFVTQLHSWMVIKRIMNSGNVCSRSVQNLLSAV